MRKISYYVYTNTDCTHYDNLNEAIEKYNSIEMKELADSVFLGIESDDISPSSGICFDVVHKFFKENMLINDWQNYKDEEDVKTAVREIIESIRITCQMTNNIFKGNCYSGTLIPFANPWIKSYTTEKMSDTWDEAYITSCNTEEYISVGWQPNNRKTRETYGWSYRNQACYIDRLNVEFINSNGSFSHRDIDPREYLDYHGYKFSDVNDFRKEGE